MDKITQTIFETILVKLEKIEKHIINQTFKKDSTPIKKGVRMASESQISYAKRLGADPWEGITHKEISELIDEGKARQESRPVTQSHSESPEVTEEKKEYTAEEKEEFPDY